jgi:hypothetical protein
MVMRSSAESARTQKMIGNPGKARSEESETAVEEIEVDGQMHRQKHRPKLP